MTTPVIGGFVVVGVRMSGSSGPPDFPFEVGDRIAVRTLSPHGEEWWFAGELTALGTGGLTLAHPKGTRMWVPWGSSPVREVSEDEWTDTVGSKQ